MTEINSNSQHLENTIKTLETRLADLEAFLGLKSSLNTKKPVLITGALELPTTKAIEVSKNKLIELYLDVPQILLEYAISVELTSESFHPQIAKGDIVLQKVIKGSYWVIATESKNEPDYWLLPNGEINFDIHRKKSVRALFHLEGEKLSHNSLFSLLEPAKLSIIPTVMNHPQEWKLEKQGTIYIGATSRSLQQRSELAQVNLQYEQIQSHIEQLTQQLSSLQTQLTQLKQVQKDVNSPTTLNQTDFNQLQTQLTLLIKSHNKLQDLINQANQERQELRSQILGLEEKLNAIQIPTSQKVIESSGNQDFFKSEADLIASYNDNAGLLRVRAIILKETQQSIKQRFQGSQNFPIFEEGNGIYWMFSIQNNYYLLIDKTKVSINEHNLKTVQAMFECRGYSLNKEFVLIQPAKVIAINDGKQWQLTTKGILEFNSILLNFNWEAFDQADVNELAGQSNTEEIVAEFQEIIAEFVEKKANLANWQNVKLLHTLTGHTNSVRAIAMSYWQGQRDRQILASGSLDNTIKIWNPQTGTLVSTLTGAASVNAIALSPDGQTLISSGDNNTLKIWNLNTAQSYSLTGHSNWILSLAISPNGQFLVSGSRDHTLKIWNLQTQQLLHDVTANHSTFVAIAISPDNQTLVSSNSDHSICLWNIQTGKLINTLFQHTNLIWSLAVSPNSQTLVCGCRDSIIQVWDLNTKKMQHSLSGHSDTVWSVAISPNGKILASGSADKTIKLWDLNTGRLLNTLTEHSEEVYSVAFSPDGQLLASSGRDETIKIWQPF